MVISQNDINHSLKPYNIRSVTEVLICAYLLQVIVW